MIMFPFSSLLLAATADSKEILKRECTFSVTAVATDSCASLASDWGITQDQFISFNPTVGPGCSNGLMTGANYCVEWNGPLPPAETSTSGASSTTLTTSTLSTKTSAPSTAPSPTQTGIVTDCTAFYQVVAQDTCQKIVDRIGTFTLNDFYTWNPAIGNDCSSLLLGYYVCVGVQSTPTAKPTTTSSHPATSTTASIPTQTGIISTCTSYYEVVAGDYCQKIVDSFGTFTLNDFYSWNPAVGDDCSGLLAGTLVCVGVSSTPTSKPTTTLATTTSAPSGPSPTQSGIISSCNSYYQVVSQDTCLKIVARYPGLTLQTFYAWNPAVAAGGSDCAYLILGYYVCVGIQT